MLPLTARFARRALDRQSAWDLSNQVLYDLCRTHPRHRDDAVIIAKVRLIGRTYAAAIERRQGRRDVAGDDFYLDVVAPEMRRSRVDRLFAPLRRLRRPDADAVLPVHARLTAVFERITGHEKRALASKYLHFHFPRAVYLFDERADRAVRRLTGAGRINASDRGSGDPAYARFFVRCAQLHESSSRSSAGA
jgi:hypothetical protein